MGHILPEPSTVPVGMPCCIDRQFYVSTQYGYGSGSGLAVADINGDASPDAIILESTTSVGGVDVFFNRNNDRDLIGSASQLVVSAAASATAGARLTSSDSKVRSTDYTFIQEDAGVHQFCSMMSTPGIQSLNIVDLFEASIRLSSSLERHVQKVICMAA